MRALILDSRGEVVGGYRRMLAGWSVTQAGLREATALLRTRDYDVVCLGEGLPVLPTCRPCLQRTSWLLHGEGYVTTLPQVRILGAARVTFRVWPRAWEDPLLPAEIPCFTGQRLGQR
jgi:hypothetical protein